MNFLNKAGMKEAFYKAKGEAKDLWANVSGDGPPDLRRDPDKWFRHFDRNGDGLERHEVVDGILKTFPGTHRHEVQELITNLWGIFDTTGTGRISRREFTKPDGLCETLLAQMGGLQQSQGYGHQGGYAQGRPSQQGQQQFGQPQQYGQYGGGGHQPPYAQQPPQYGGGGGGGGDGES
mmetsp:Transcript_66837/g.145246  ORF Transcript_66837/g.145246 Transcript_66837/m.145246 type:complete len:178 (-) Transcript_66837:115-648(-)